MTGNLKNDLFGLNVKHLNLRCKPSPAILNGTFNPNQKLAVQ